jgi:hypothetical protein
VSGVVLGSDRYRQRERCRAAEVHVVLAHRSPLLIQVMLRWCPPAVWQTRPVQAASTWYRRRSLRLHTFGRGA